MNVTDRKKAKKTKLEVFKQSTLYVWQQLVFVDAYKVSTKWTEAKETTSNTLFFFSLAILL